MKNQEMVFQLFFTLLVLVSMTGCNTLSLSSPTPLPTVVLDARESAPLATLPANAPIVPSPSAEAQEDLPERSSVVSASAEIAPEQSADLAFTTFCFVQGLAVKEGRMVQAGEVLATQNNLTQLQSSLEASRQALVSAQKNYDRLLENVPVERASAQLALVRAQKTLEDAQKESRSKLYQRASQETIDIARARLIETNEALDDAEVNYSRAASVSSANLNYAAALTALARARQEQIRAEYNLNYVMGLPSPLAIEETDATLTLAEAEVLAAKQAWERVKNGDPDDQQASAILAQVSSAQASIDTAQHALDQAMLRAPFDGTVISVSVVNGQAVSPGQVVLTIANLNNLLVETTDLSERDVSQVNVGQPARVTVEGLEKTFLGKVIKIAPRSTKLGGDVVYKVTIELNEQPPALRWGMSATVQIGQ